MDKSWTKLRNRLCKEYSDGVRSFISLAKEHVDHRGFTRCPCKNCQNVIMKPPCEVEGDLYKYGMSFTYDRWTCRGETPDLSLYPKPKETVEKHKELTTTSQNIDTENNQVRGSSRGVGIERIIEATGQRLKVNWDLQYDKPVGGNATRFNNEIGILVRSVIPLKYSSKKQIPNEIFIDIINQLKNKFDVDHSEDYVKNFLYYEIGDRYKDYRSRLYTYYQKMSDPAQARGLPYKNVTLEDWKLLCDRWETHAWKVKSEKNKESRSKLPYNHCAGTKSFRSHREEKISEDGTYLSPIDIFHHTHCSVAKGWTNPVAGELHEKMVAQKGAQTYSSTPMTDEEIMADVLGKKKAYVKGMGYGAKPPHSHRKSTYSQEYVQSLETQLADMKEQLTTKCSSMEATIQSQRQEMEMRDHEYERRFRQMNDILERFTAANPPLSKD